MAGSAVPKVFFLKFAILLLGLASYHLIPGIHDFISAGVGYLHHRDFEGLRQFILSYGLWAPVTTIALMTLQSAVPLVPGLTITITNAWIFGWQYGALYSWVGALLGALLDFGIARWYGRPFVERLVKPEQLDLADRFFKRYGVLAVFITRLTPVIPFKVISYGGGLTNIPVAQFALATAGGQTPAIIVYSILGQHLLSSLGMTLAITAFLLLLGFAAYYYRYKIEHYFFPDKE